MTKRYFEYETTEGLRVAILDMVSEAALDLFTDKDYETGPTVSDLDHALNSGAVTIGDLAKAFLDAVDLHRKKPDED
jgi:hypothetical protein